MGTENSKKLKYCKENIYMERKRSIARTVSIEAVLHPRFHYAVNYSSFDAGVLIAFFVFGDIFFTLGSMVNIVLGSDRRR